MSLAVTVDIHCSRAAEGLRDRTADVAVAVAGTEEGGVVGTGEGGAAEPEAAGRAVVQTQLSDTRWAAARMSPEDKRFAGEVRMGKHQED